MQSGGSRDVAAFLFASRIESLEMDEGCKKKRKNARGLAYVKKMLYLCNVK